MLKNNLSSHKELKVAAVQTVKSSAALVKLESGTQDRLEILQSLHLQGRQPTDLLCVSAGLLAELSSSVLPKIHQLDVHTHPMLRLGLPQ